jgi:hypothetical protein
MSILRPRLAFFLVSIALAASAAGCHKDASTESDGDEPTADEASSPGPDQREVARKLGLTPDQEARYADYERGEGRHGHGGRHRGARIERRVERISRALGLTPEQSEKLRLILREDAMRAMRRHRMHAGAEDPRFPQGGPGFPQGGRFRRGGGGFPQGGPGFPQGGRGFPQGGPDQPQFQQGPEGPDGPQGPQDPQDRPDRYEPSEI